MVNPGQEYFLKPCSGTSELGILNGHLYAVNLLLDGGEGERIGYATLKNAEKIFGKEKLVVSGSSTLCAICFQHLNENLASRLEKPFKILTHKLDS